MKGRTIIITGASSGIGKALSMELGAAGARVVMGARQAEGLRAMQETFAAHGWEGLTLQTDVSVETDCQRLVQAAVEAYGGVDVLINNAGISMRALFDGIDLKVLRRLMDVNYWGTVYCSYYALPHLLKSKGSLVGISSIAGFKGLPGRTGYSSSKFAMHGFLEVVRMENRRNGLHVLLACPGFTASNIRNTALGADGQVQGESPRDEARMMSAEEVARHVIRAIEMRKRTLVLTTQGKFTVLMNKFFPAFMDKMVYNHMAKEPGSPFQ
ncbi:MAG TPA: SDR family oxidoreductase [Bacteroidales bacterium]|nr:SDR family oxidoreductase [Bacteroidales bacterium]HRZ76484.1 SDR family oxidoreductase [Bacteroidales bacterium]